MQLAKHFTQYTLSPYLFGCRHCTSMHGKYVFVVADGGGGGDGGGATATNFQLYPINVSLLRIWVTLTVAKFI